MLLAMLIGAGAGIVVGFATSHEQWSFLVWRTGRTSDAVAFAAVGAMVVGGGGKRLARLELTPQKMAQRPEDSGRWVWG